MLKITKKLIASNSKDYFSDTEVITILGKEISPSTRYGLIKRALAKGEILRLKRGFYLLAEEYRRKKVNLFEIANHLYHPSYISLESALSYYGAIPEAVYSTTCISTNRKKLLKHLLEKFNYFRIPEKCFYYGTNRITSDSGIFLIASLEKAILDYIKVYKKSWSTLSELIEDIRFDEELIEKLDYQKLKLLSELYKNNKVEQFINSIKKDLAK